MKFSQFNIIAECDNHFVVYNTLRGSICKICKSDYSLENKNLISSGFIIQDNIDELNEYKYKYYSGMFSRGRLNISIATTMSCNLRCPYCFEEGGKSKDRLTEQVEESIIKFIKAKESKKINLVWFGGEPLLNFKSISTISTQLIQANIDFNASIITNGTLLTKEIIKSFDRFNISSVQISLDGQKEQHDTKRFFSGGNGTFDIIIENVKTVLQHSKTIVTLKTNIDFNNYLSYKALQSFLFKEFESYIKLGKLIILTNSVKNRTGFDGCENCMTEKDYYDFKQNVLGEKNELPFFHGACPLRSVSSFVIGPDGSIYKCLEFLGHKEKSIGNIINLNYSISKIANYVFSFNPFDDENCKICPVLPICGGGCPIDRKRKSDGERIDICSFYKTNINDILTEIYK